MIRESLSDFYEQPNRGIRRHDRLKKALAGFSVAASLISLAACDQESQGSAVKVPASTLQSQKLTATREVGISSSRSAVATTTAAMTTSQELTSAPATIEATATSHDLEVFYGQDCQAIVETKPTNLITMDYLHSDQLEVVDSSLDGRGLKYGLTNRVSQVLAQSNKDYYTKLTNQQQATLRASINQLVEATYSSDVLPNDKSYYITVASFLSGESQSVKPATQVYDSGQRLGDQPVYLQPELNYCVFDLDEAQIQ